jgi:shikimate kinase
MMDEPVSARPAGKRPLCRAIALVGFMGAGKTVVAKEVAAQLAWRFVDLDELVENRQGWSISEIFKQKGEAEFRRLECSSLIELIGSMERDPVALALGGGAFAQSKVQECLSHAGIPAVFLDAPVQELFQRCEQAGIERPLRRDFDDFRNLYERRRPEYLKAAMRVETAGKAVSAIAEEIISGLQLRPAPGARD